MQKGISVPGKVYAVIVYNYTEAGRSRVQVLKLLHGNAYAHKSAAVLDY